MAGLGRYQPMSGATVGVVGAVEVNHSEPVSSTDFPGTDEAAFWAMVWFVAAIVLLYFIL